MVSKLTSYNLTLRKAKLSDFNAIKNLRQEASKRSISHYSEKDVEVMNHAGEHFILDFINPYRKTYVGISNDYIVGYITLNLSKKWLWHLFVDSKFQGKGIGKSLMNKVENIFKQNHLDEINLYARLNAVEFYKKRGFIDKGKWPWKNIFTGYREIELRRMIKKI